MNNKKILIAIKRAVKKIVILTRLNNVRYALFSKAKSQRCSIDPNVARLQLESISPHPNNSSITNNRINEPCCDLQIIIPAYNREKYIKECIDSVLDQKTKYSYKIIVINDGSTDTTGNIVDGYKTDDRVVVIHQENRGFSGARNRGLEQISAKYIAFLDSDDKLFPGAIESMLDAAISENADIVEGGFYKLNGETLSVRYRHKSAKTVKAHELKGFPCGKVFRATLFKNICFPLNFWFEDTIMAFLIYPLAKKSYIIPSMVYVYRYNENSISNTFSVSPKAIDTYWVTEQIVFDRQLIKMTWTESDCIRFFEQVIINYKRTKDMPCEIKEYIFACTVELYNKICTSEFLKAKKFKSLIRSFRDNDFGRYSYFCQTYLLQ